MQPRRSTCSILDLVEAGLLQRNQELRFRRDATRVATVTDLGHVHYDGTDFHSLSTAARAAAGGTSTNGWPAWYANVDDRWVPLTDLRARVRSSDAARSDK